ncbi:hypothetical protein MBUL_04014 [Methylobacterium bullatum]|uniref:Outer membrane protein beta-barrel domain-containing protein n=1 Tax=Methylobacterium bullatum TaxID=570505 RepID=A0A679J870_9HYPH|nr:hypothetical protein MBUL_04014 [Methylobacterium bullatum]
MKRVLLGTVTLLALMPRAWAADVPVRSPQLLSQPTPTFTWTGLYIGVNASGVVDGDFRASTLPPLPSATGRLSAAGYVAGGTVGYNYQPMPGYGLVVGIEGDAGYADIHNQARVIIPSLGAASLGVQTDTYFATVRGRFGYAWGPLLAYATGGWAFTQIGADASAVIPAFALAGTFARTSAFDGYTVGAGLEFAISPNVSLKGEYLYADFDKRFAVIPGQSIANVKSGLNINQLKIGINYRFDVF